MKIIHINQSDFIGGAGRAAYRLHHALRGMGVDSFMWVNRATLGDWTVSGASNKKELALNLLRPSLVWPLKKIAKATHAPHSINILPSKWVKKINESDADIINLHWINGEMISIKEIGKIKKPIVWTMHDMWPFCGAEHYTESKRWKEGYNKGNKDLDKGSFDLNKFVWRQKMRYWKRPFYIVAPSIWLADCVKESKLMKYWPVQYIPNPIDTLRWKCVDKEIARSLLGLSLDKFFILFGAIGGASDYRKGFDLLEGALRILASKKDLYQNIEIIVFGQLEPRKPIDYGFKTHFMGHLHDDLSLNLLYSACDVFILPSRQENCSLAVLESQASGTPVIAFNATGTSCIVDHKKTGYLAEHNDIHGLVKGIEWFLDGKNKVSIRSISQYATNHFDSRKIAKEYFDLYDSILSSKRIKY